MSAPRSTLTRFAWLSIAAAVVIIVLKSAAYWLTGSVGLLSDALESLVNLVAASVALVALTVAARPADEDHPFGHDKAEYLSSGLEGGGGGPRVDRCYPVSSLEIRWTVASEGVPPCDGRARGADSL